VIEWSRFSLLIRRIQNAPIESRFGRAGAHSAPREDLTYIRRGNFRTESASSRVQHATEVLGRSRILSMHRAIRSARRGLSTEKRLKKGTTKPTQRARNSDLIPAGAMFRRSPQVLARSNGSEPDPQADDRKSEPFPGWFRYGSGSGFV